MDSEGKDMGRKWKSVKRRRDGKRMHNIASDYKWKEIEQHGKS